MISKILILKISIYCEIKSLYFYIIFFSESAKEIKQTEISEVAQERCPFPRPGEPGDDGEVGR